ncbi:uncharacterized protein SCHCODRAFT_02489565 [Schizophyllum commune H4-8]|uniref:CxC2-like cysteine cluster KDZ transposase-associated domain-containing protein n=1 Tax=Schizophyllum commune (strain H4-8 / FGSC 9210) TaxID=578458 RepID=D8PM75_SCHCM|nr:uncharacterized protein SCHCODRAFT_02489565 [Schizophyllum commune H4-8]KAI5897299.1 hypothetical protein SCHCODRAFT_02489565 [Schizophyllum commune H4-8]
MLVGLLFQLSSAPLCPQPSALKTRVRPIFLLSEPPRSTLSLVIMPPASPRYLSSFGEDDTDVLSSPFLTGGALPISRTHSPIENCLFDENPPTYDDVFTAISTTPPEHLARPSSPAGDSDKENEWPVAAAVEPHSPRNSFLRAITVTSEQMIKYRLTRALNEGRELTVPEMVECRVIFLDESFEADLMVWRTRALGFWYMHDPEDALKEPQDQWWKMTGEDYRQFTRRLTLPPFSPPTKLVQYMPLPPPSNPDFTIGPRPVLGSALVEVLLSDLTPRDLAHATAGSTLRPVRGNTYKFIDFYPELEQPMTFEAACRANGLGTPKILRLSGKAPACELPLTPPVRDFPTMLDDSPDLPELVPALSSPFSSPSPSSTPRTRSWGSSSTLFSSSPLPPSEFEYDSGAEPASPTPARNWKTGQRVEGPRGRWYMPNRVVFRQPRNSRLSAEGICAADVCLAWEDCPELGRERSQLVMSSHKPGARRKDRGFGHDMDMRTNLAAHPQHISFVLSQDSRRMNSTAATFQLPTAKKPRKAADLKAPHSEWRPIEDCDEDDIAFQYPGADADDLEPDEVHCEPGDKRKRQADPMDTWKAFSDQTYLDEMMWGEGLRNSLADPHCSTCLDKYTPPDPARPNVIPASSHPTPGHTDRLFCCWECGDFNECLDCCLDRHQCMPLHTIEEWTGEYWSKVTLSSMGLVYQLGHGGRPCPRPEPAVRTVTVLDYGIHTVRLRYCGCRLGPTTEHAVQLLRNRWYPATATNPETCATFALLDWFRLASVHANVNTHGLIKVLEMRTDPLGLKSVPRAGIGNTKKGIKGTKPGELAIRCWACPRVGVNLPPDWQNVAAAEMYRFRTMLAVDANFRLKNRIRKNENRASALGEGLGYFVATEPYKDHISGYVKESDISSCIAFAALAEKDTKITKGLRVSGVGGVICARHELVQPHGFADLQKGERYCNMDYVLCSVLSQIGSAHTTCSYDIGCQYMTNFYERVKKLPAHLQPDPLADLSFGLLVWHGAIHEESCRSRNSLKYHDGVGRTDGEGIERIWSLFNAISYATKEMGEGARHDAIEDKSDSVNFVKNIHQYPTLLRKLVIALDERQVQIEAFKVVNENVDRRQIMVWEAEVRNWRKDPSSKSPFAMPTAQGVSEAEVRRMLDSEEMEDVKQGRAGVHTTSQTTFLTAGFQLEAAQRRIMADLNGPAVLPMNLEGLINNRRRAFLTKKDNFEQLQKLYMPGAQAWIESSEADSQRAIDAEQMNLYMPSDLPSNIRRMSCAEGLPEKELKLRVAQARDFLDAIRRKLHAKQYHIVWRNENATGQKKSTRARQLLETLQNKINLDAVGYRHAREAILALRGVLDAPDFPPLLASDLRLEGEEEEPDAASISAIARAGQVNRPQHIHVSTGTQRMSWIWTATGLPDTQKDANVVETVRCLWAKALARKERWQEEVVILQEEMRRCLRSLESESQAWRTRAGVDIGRGVEYASGVHAYGMRHAEQRLAIRNHFLEGWNKPVGRAKRKIFEDQRHSGALDEDLAASLAAARAMMEGGGAIRTELAAAVLAGDGTSRRRAGRLRGQGRIGWEQHRERTRALRRRSNGLVQAFSGVKVARRQWYAGVQGNEDAREGESVRQQRDDTGGEGKTRTQRPTSSRMKTGGQARRAQAESGDVKHAREAGAKAEGGEGRARGEGTRIRGVRVRACAQEGEHTRGECGWRARARKAQASEARRRAKRAGGRGAQAGEARRRARHGMEGEKRAWAGERARRRDSTRAGKEYARGEGVPEPEPRIAETRKAEERGYDEEDARRPHAKQLDIDSQWTRADQEGAKAVLTGWTAARGPKLGERGAGEGGKGAGRAPAAPEPARRRTTVINH